MEESPRELDLAIVGNGAIGCALALRFSATHPDASIALIGPRRRPDSASSAAGAMLNVFAELEPGALAYPVARRKVELARAASAAWPRHLELLNRRSGATLAIEQGTYLLDTSARTAKDADRFDAILGYMRELGEPFRTVPPAEIQALHVRAPASQRAVYIEEEGRIDARALLHAYDDAFARSPNIDVIDDEVVAITPSRQLQLRAGTGLRARLVVLAAGVKSQDLIDGLGLTARIPRLVAGMGTAVIVSGLTELPSKVIRCVGDAGSVGDVYVVPCEDGRVYIGATTHLRLRGASAPREDDVPQLIESAARSVNADFARARVEQVLIGCRPITLDTYPLLGKTSHDGIWIATGTRRDGLHLSPHIADELVRCMACDEQPFAGTFRPERPLLLEVPRALATDHAVASMERAGRADRARAYVEAIYRGSGFADHPFGLPTEMLEIFRQLGTSDVS